MNSIAHWCQTFSKKQWQRALSQPIAVLVVVLLSPLAHAQIPSAVTLTASTNPIQAGQTVSLSAVVSSRQVVYRVKAGIGRSAGSSLYYRFDLTGASFSTAVTANRFVNETTPASFSSVVVSQGGGVGERSIVFQATAGAGGLLGTDDLTFTFVPDVVAAPAQVSMSLHETLGSAIANSLNPDTALLRVGPVGLASIPPPFTITGVLVFRVNGIVIPACAAVAVAAGSGVCSFIPQTAGLLTVSADYGGDVNFAGSTGTLQGGLSVLLDISPLVQQSATVGVAYSSSITGVGGTPPYTFSFESGQLPNGLTLNSVGLLSGMPSRAGAFDFVVRVTDSTGATSNRATSMLVARGTQTLSLDLPARATEGTSLAIPQVTSAGLTVSYFVSPNAVCTLSGASLRFVAPGMCTVAPAQTGNESYLALPPSTGTVQVVVAEGLQPIRFRSTAGASLALSQIGNDFQLGSIPDLGSAFRALGWVDVTGNKVADYLFLNTTQGDSGEVRLWADGVAANDRVLRSVRLLWRVDAVGDLDGDGFGDIVWRFTGQTQNADDTGVSYVWFTNGNSVAQVRKRGGAPLSWTLLGAKDLNRDGAADMIYISPTGDVRALLAMPSRTCANFGAGNVPPGFTALGVGSYSARGRGEVLMRAAGTGETRLLRIDGTGTVLPPPSANPDDPNAPCAPGATTLPNTTVAWLTADPSWDYVGYGDFNGDGVSDIVWIRPNRTLVVWLSNPADGSFSAVDTGVLVPNGFSVVLQ